MSNGSVLRAIDANVILRYLFEDIPAQFDAARRLIESDQQLGLSPVALAEIAWTVTGPYYRIERQRVAVLLTEILSRENIVTLGFSKEEALSALLRSAADAAPADFGDGLIAACALSAGVDEIYSFDLRFARTGISPVIPE